MDNKIQEKVLKKIGNDKELTEKEKKVIVALKRKGLVRITRDQIELTHYGRVITVLGYDSLIRAEEMEKSLSSFSLEDHEKSQMILVIMYALLVLFLLILMSMEGLLYWKPT